MANRMLTLMKPPALPQGIKRMTKWINAEKRGRIKMTMYRPESLDEPLPCLVYFHGGGFCLEDAPYIHEHMIQYAVKAKCQVVFVHYRTSDRYPFPMPFTDCWAGLEYVQKNCEKLHINPEKIAVGGDSAGGALAAACALRNRDEAREKLCFQMLIYPVIDARMETASMKMYKDSPVWNARLSEKCGEIYLRNGTFGWRSYASPAQAQNFQHLPPAYIEVEQYDCLHDEGVDYWRALKKADVFAQLRDVKGTFHGFDVFTDKELTKKAVDARCRALYRAFWK